MARIGYARISTNEQNLDRQLERLQDTEKIFQEAASGARRDPLQLETLRYDIRDGGVGVGTD